MKIGVFIYGENPQELVSKARDLEERGFNSVWLGNPVGYGVDPLASISLIASETKRIELGTAVVPIYLHHPVVLAHQAITIQQVAQGRFTLGIGLSHPVIVEDWLGLSYKNSLARMREYISILRPILNGDMVTFKGDYYGANTGVHLTNVEPVPLLTAALGSKMLQLAGEMTDGTVTYLTGLRTLEGHIVPGIRSAAKEHGQPTPRIIAGGLPMALVDDAEGVRAAIAKDYAGYAELPSYRAMFNREGVADAGGVALVGNVDVLKASLKHLADIGVTDLMASVYATDDNSYDRTLDFLTTQL